MAKRTISRRTALGFGAGALAAAALPAWGAPPSVSLRPVPRGGRTREVPSLADVIASAGMAGSAGVVVADVGTGEVLETYRPLVSQPPASTAKALTALYAHARLGPEHRFETRLIATGPVIDGRIEGDLILAGSGDPTLDTDHLGELAAALKEAGVFDVKGRFRIWSGALPTVPSIDPEQPPHVGYNPTVSGLNLNYNRVHFQWKRESSGYALSMEARARRFQPAVDIARMEVVDRTLPVFTYASDAGIDRWTVARRALGNGGSRWLPVRSPEAYASEVFRSIARSYGLELRPGDPVTAPPEGEVLAVHRSAALPEMLRGMLEYSTNLTAEVLGLASTRATGGVPSLRISAAEMNLWTSERYGLRRPALVDHSGLSDLSRIHASDMAKAMVAARGAAPIRELLKTIPVRDGAGGTLPASQARVEAKTGTLNFVSSLAGYLTAPGGRELAFAILTADLPKRARGEASGDERPDGARPWAGRSRSLQHALLRRWAAAYRTG